MLQGHRMVIYKYTLSHIHIFLYCAVTTLGLCGDLGDICKI